MSLSLIRTPLVFVVPLAIFTQATAVAILVLLTLIVGPILLGAVSIAAITWSRALCCLLVLHTLLPSSTVMVHPLLLHLSPSTAPSSSPTFVVLCLPLIVPNICGSVLAFHRPPNLWF